MTCLVWSGYYLRRKAFVSLGGKGKIFSEIENLHDDFIMSGQ